MHARAFSDFCGPRALALVAAISPERAADEIRRIQTISGEEHGDGTSDRVLLAALLERGFRVEAWRVGPSGWRTSEAATIEEVAHHAQAIESLAAEVRADAARPRQPPQPLPELPAEYCAEMRRRAALSAQRWERRCVSSLMVSQWLLRRPVGTWILSAAHHWLVARCGVIAVGDDVHASTYGKFGLNSAWRVWPRSGVWRARLRR